jgi:coproporphyrinogen III oxidase-like Fe-S oxidoreductase
MNHALLAFFCNLSHHVAQEKPAYELKWGAGRLFSKENRMISSLLAKILTRSLRPFEFKPDCPAAPVFKADGVGLYFHIPFCRELCDFCPYFKEVYDEGAVEPFLQALTGEIDLVSARLSGKRIISVYFGGGTPALLIDHFPDLVRRIRSRFDVQGDFAVELHPDNLVPDTLDILKASGFGKISVGIQSFKQHLHKNLGRAGGINVGPAAFSLLKNYPFEVIDVDLILGIPGQTVEDALNDFRHALAMGATQISAYPFIRFSYASVKRNPLSAGKKKAMLEALTALAAAHGFERTSVWTFARKDTGRYSSVTRENFAGLGPGAVTLSDNLFAINTFSVREYIKAVERNRNGVGLTLEFNKRTRAAYWLFWACYNLEINRHSFFRMFAEDLGRYFRWELSLAQRLGLIARNADGFVLTARGAYYFHLVEQHFTHQYIDKTWRIMRRNPRPQKLVIH